MHVGQERSLSHEKTFTWLGRLVGPAEARNRRHDDVEAYASFRAEIEAEPRRIAEHGNDLVEVPERARIAMDKQKWIALFALLLRVADVKEVDPKALNFGPEMCVTGPKPRHKKCGRLRRLPSGEFYTFNFSIYLFSFKTF